MQTICACPRQTVSCGCFGASVLLPPGRSAAGTVDRIGRVGAGCRLQPIRQSGGVPELDGAIGRADTVLPDGHHFGLIRNFDPTYGIHPLGTVGARLEAVRLGPLLLILYR